MISAKKRFEILKRDKFRCQYCWKTWKDVSLEIDHIIPKSKWGTDDVWNLITCCRECNAWKWKTSLDETELWKDKIIDLGNRIKKDFNTMWNWKYLWMIDKPTYILLLTYIDYCINTHYTPNSIDIRDVEYCLYWRDFAWNRPNNNSDWRNNYCKRLENEFLKWEKFCDGCCKMSYAQIIDAIEDFINDIMNDSDWTWWKSFTEWWESDYRLNYLLTRELMWYYAWWKWDINAPSSKFKFLTIKYTYRKDLIEHFENEWY